MEYFRYIFLRIFKMNTMMNFRKLCTFVNTHYAPTNVNLVNTIQICIVTYLYNHSYLHIVV